MSTPDFDKVWGSNSSLTPYEFSDSEYLKGWESVGATPPTRTQFDALQRNNDLKAQYLKDGLDEVKAAVQDDTREPSTEYAVGTIIANKDLPATFYLKCKVGGTSSDTSLVVPSDIEEGDTITDGTVVWEAFRLASNDDLQTFEVSSKKALSESTGYGIVSGCEPSISGLTVTVASGVVHLSDGTRKEIASTNITLDSADPTNPRIDLVYIDSTGAVAKITGTAAASPSVPALPSNGIKVCVVTVAANASTGVVTDSRDMLPRWYNTGIVNVKDFGAVGDGVHDDTEAFENAIKAIMYTGGTIYIPRGTYITEINADWSGARTADGFPWWETLEKNISFTICGDGGYSILKAKSGGNGYALRIACPYAVNTNTMHQHNIRLRDFEVDMNGESKGIDLFEVKSPFIERINIYGGVDKTGPSDAYAIGLVGCGMSRVSKLYLKGTGMQTGSGIYIGIGSDDSVFTQCDIGGFGYGMYLVDIGDNAITENVTYGQAVDGICIITNKVDSSANRITNNQLAYTGRNIITVNNNDSTKAALNTIIANNHIWMQHEYGNGIVIGKAIRTEISGNTFDGGGMSAGVSAIKLQSHASLWSVHHNIISYIADGATGIDVSGVYGDISFNSLLKCANSENTKFIALASSNIARVRVAFNVSYEGGAQSYGLYIDSPNGTLTVAFNKFWAQKVSNYITTWMTEINTNRVFGSVEGFQLIDNAWNLNPLRLGDYYLWVSAAGKLMIKNGQPQSDADGTVVGTQS